MRDFTDDIKDLRRRLDEAAAYLKITEKRARLGELELEVSRPDLWDDQDLAKKVNTEYSNVKSDIDTFDTLSGTIDDIGLLHEMAREVDDEGQEPELVDGIATTASTKVSSSIFIRRTVARRVWQISTRLTTVAFTVCVA